MKKTRLHRQYIPFISYPHDTSDWQDDLYTHILTLVHQLAVDENLVSTYTVAYGICWISRRGDLNLTPLLVRRHELALRGEPLELLVDSLLFDTAFTLDQRRGC